jgi:hypothetical protein
MHKEPALLVAQHPGLATFSAFASTIVQQTPDVLPQGADKHYSSINSGFMHIPHAPLSPATSLPQGSTAHSAIFTANQPTYMCATPAALLRADRTKVPCEGVGCRTADDLAGSGHHFSSQGVSWANHLQDNRQTMHV